MRSQERRFKTEIKIAKRARMAKEHGLREGTIYKRHTDKLDTSYGYIRAGHITHFVRVGFGRKTNNKGQYGKRYNPSIRDMRTLSKHKNQLDELNYQEELSDEREEN